MVVYNLQLSFYSRKLIFVLFRVRKNILNIIFILLSFIKKISSKNLDLLALSSIEKDVIIISKVLRLEPSIF